MTTSAPTRQELQAQLDRLNEPDPEEVRKRDLLRQKADLRSQIQDLDRQEAAAASLVNYQAAAREFDILRAAVDRRIAQLGEMAGPFYALAVEAHDLAATGLVSAYQEMLRQRQADPTLVARLEAVEGKVHRQQPVPFSVEQMLNSALGDQVRAARTSLEEAIASEGVGPSDQTGRSRVRLLLSRSRYLQARAKVAQEVAQGE